MLRPVSAVTGAAGGLGYAVAEGLARAGHFVVVTGRDVARGEAALSRLRAAVPGAEARFELLDVASLGSVAAFAERAAAYGAIDVLVNNAGVMALPTRQATEDGFEMQLGTNYLGHFALTARLLPLLLLAPHARVVSVSSLAHRAARIDFDDLQGERAYRPMRAYRQSKLAMLMFARELQRQASEHGWALTSIAAHPGWSATRIILNGMGGDLRGRIMQAGFNLLGQSAANGARPILFAALSTEAQPGGYYGPSGFGEVRGPPSPSKVMPQAQDAAAAHRLWDVSESLTGAAFPR